MVKEKVDLEEKIIEIVMDALGIDDEEVTRESNIVDELAAESIDFVDIAFSLEQEFGIKVNPGDIFPGFLREVEMFDENKKLTPEVLSRFNKDYAFINEKLISEFEKSGDANVFFTVETVIDFIESKIAEK